MTDQDITKLASKLTKFLATKGDIQEVKADLGGVKGDIQEVKADLGGVKGDIKRLEVKVDSGIKRLEKKIDELDDKADTILEFAEAVDETVTDHGKRLKRIETVSAVAHQIKR